MSPGINFLIFCCRFTFWLISLRLYCSKFSADFPSKTNYFIFASRAYNSRFASCLVYYLIICLLLSTSEWGSLHTLDIPRSLATSINLEYGHLSSKRTFSISWSDMFYLTDLNSYLRFGRSAVFRYTSSILEKMSLWSEQSKSSSLIRGLSGALAEM